MNKLISLSALCIACLSLFSCNNDGKDDPFILKTGMAYVIATDNQGLGAITSYEPETMTATQNAYYKINRTNIGTNPVSINFSNHTGYITVGNELNVIDPMSIISKGKITKLESPAYSVFLGLDKAFVSNSKHNNISIINPANYSLTGKIELPENTFAKNAITWNNKVYFNTNSKTESKIIEITSERNDEGVVEDVISREIKIKLNSENLHIDRHGTLWTMSIGDKMNNPNGTVNHSIQRINPVSMEILGEFNLTNTGINKPMMKMLNGMLELYYILGDNV